MVVAEARITACVIRDFEGPTALTSLFVLTIVAEMECVMQTGVAYAIQIGPVSFVIHLHARISNGVQVRGYMLININSSL